MAQTVEHVDGEIKGQMRGYASQYYEKARGSFQAKSGVAFAGWP
jgi:hypothetical protein